MFFHASFAREPPVAQRWRAMSYRRNNRPSQPCRDWKEGNPSSCRHGQNCRSDAVSPFLLCGADGADVPSAALALLRRPVVALTNLQCARLRRFLHTSGGRSTDPPATMAPVAAAADAKPAGLGAFGFAAASGPPSLDPYLHVACMSQSGPGAHSHRETLFRCRAARACS